ncbi:rifin PIR protein, putative [Plasmodium reichenowi]|uniref:Rifin PIR protein, putative n=1 Tax=Plasmodium reichenowi TaxID=5854 RepID=A0A2P9D9C7_PLARE|nr:rifin PIR protein, putative [Plasmodium reichenowi]
MKFHYINILLFALPLNILIYNQRNHYTTRYKPTNRVLCECELYIPNYDNDPEMKKIMQQFEDRTSQRLHKYDDRMIERRMQCKERCDKEIQKIILKDKLEKELIDKFATLHTDIQNDAIPTCICEKSMADKVEKGCLRCGGVLGGGIASSVGILGGIGEAAMSAWKVAALKYATKYAMNEGAAVGKIIGDTLGKNAVIGGLKKHFFIKELGINSLDPYFTTTYNFDIKELASFILSRRDAVCGAGKNLGKATCDKISIGIGTMTKSDPQPPPGIDPIVQRLKFFANKGKTTADYYTRAASEKVTDIITRQQTSEIAATYASYEITIIASIVAIVVIVLIMVIIYLILRYRRKKKMKKKLQYIKLLEQ